MSIETIYDFLKKCPNNDFQLVNHDEPRNICVWISPMHDNDASWVYKSYPAITIHYFIMQKAHQIRNIVNCWRVKPNSIVSSYGFYSGLQGKIIFKEEFYLGIGYSL